MVGKRISHYCITEKLGQGGMGVVYKAEDTKLKRHVALKFLPQELTHNGEVVDRFIQEAQAASALDHPHICTIHEIDEDENGQLFIVMAYYEGRTLSERLEGGPLEIEEAVNIAEQVAEGLARAHAAGMTHRDIKPANIIITKRGEVKIIDFGLAKLAGTTKLTKTGTALGTIAYMSPQQVRCEEVDQRTDIWSLGVLLYEMVTGQTPFQGDHDAAVIFSIVNQEPKPLADAKQAAEPLQWIVDKALDKDPETRYQNMKDLREDLKRVTRGDSARPQQPSTTKTVKRHKKRAAIFAFLALLLIAAMIRITGYFLSHQNETEKPITIAVVDFANKTNEKELDGLSGLLTTALQQSRRLAVLPRSRMFDILRQIGIDEVDRIDEGLGRKICQKAKVKAMVTGSVRKLGRLYTMDVKVLDLDREEYLLATREQGQGHESILRMIDNIAEETRKGLSEEHDQIQAVSQKVADVTTTNLKAYQHYFQGEQFINKLRFKEAKEEFEKAIVLDSTFGLPYYRLSYISLWWNSEPIDYEYMIQKAMALIDRIPEKERFLVRAEYDRVYAGGWPAAIVALKEMEKRYPGEKEMMFILGDGAYHTGDYPRALKYLDNVLSIDPTHERALQHLVRTFRDIGDFEPMLETSEQYAAVTASPEAYSLLANAYAAVGRYEQGIERIKQVRELFPQENEFTSIIANLYMIQGKYDLAERELVPLVKDGQPSRSKHIGYSGLRVLYNLTGQYRNAIEMCEREIKLYWQERDTTSAAITHIRKALLVVDGWHDIARAWREVNKTFGFRNSILSGSYLANLFDLYVYHGDYAMADSLLKIGAVTVNSNRAFFHSVKGECNEADKYAAKVLMAAEPWRKLFVLYPLAKCKFQAEEFKNALSYLVEFQKFSFSLRSTRARYYAKSFYLLGRVYEQLGQPNLAVKNYETLIDIWQNADSDLPELVYTRAHLSELKPIVAN
ncbi:MAG: protein kinase [bacterium]